MDIMQTLTNISTNALRDAIKLEYSEVALNPRKGYHFHTGREAANRIGYNPELYAELPEDNINSFAGTGNPLNLGPINSGDVVVDVGSGAGFDSLIAARLVGPHGWVIGIDMTAEMIARARAGAESMALANAEFKQGYADELPLPDNFADVIISNGVLNLTPDKSKTLKEWARVLKPGGRLFFGDIVIEKKMTQEALDDISLWTGWIAGGLLEADLVAIVEKAGFEKVEIRQRHAIFEDVPNPSSALEFGTKGISLKALKKADRSSA